jgi:NAD(P)-dependent dehydrogenase (short-subunit alcohol dehydrogenase family)
MVEKTSAQSFERKPVPSRSFDKNSTASEVAAGLDLSRLNTVVTGASGGLGAETARALAERGARVTLGARDLAKAGQVASEIRRSTGNDRVEVLPLTLDVPRSVRDFARQFLGAHESLDVLINNAGVMACPLSRTAQGYESQFATNHLGHFLLACLLAPALKKSGHARVVSVSSRGHRFSPVVFEDIHYEKRPYDKWNAYGQSKTANVLFAVEFDRRLKDHGVRAFGLHPGAIVTELGRHLQRSDIEELQARAPGGRMEWKSVPAGAATSVWAATAPELEGQGALYLEDCHIAKPRSGPADEGGYEPYALDPEQAKKLWTASEEMVGERFPLAR